MKRIFKLANMFYLSLWMIVVVSLLFINLVKESLSTFFAAKKSQTDILQRRKKQTRYIITPGI